MKEAGQASLIFGFKKQRKEESSDEETNYD
jgi:hypothetical protein